MHPGTPITGVTSGTFTIPTTGHDFSGNTRYQVGLTVTDSSGLQSTSTVTVVPQKVNLNFAAVPAGATVFLDGIAHTAPFVYDTLVGFNHTIAAPNQTIGGNTYNFASWSDGGAQTHTIVVPAAAQTYTANFNAAAVSPPAFVQVNAAVPQTNQSSVPVTYTSAQTAGNTNILAIGWNDATSNITSVTDSAGNAYQLAVPTARGSGVSQAIYYATNIKAAPAGTNTVTVTFNTATPYVDIRALEYSGLDPVNPFDDGRLGVGHRHHRQQRHRHHHRRQRAGLRRRDDHRLLRCRTRAVHHPHHHQPRRRHRPRPHRHHHRGLQRHRTAERLGLLGDAGRHVQGGGRAPAGMSRRRLLSSPLLPPGPSRAR